MQGNQDDTSLKQHVVSTVIFKMLVYLNEVDEWSSDVIQFIQKISGLTLILTVNPLNTKLYLSDLKTQLVPRSKHSASVLKTDKLMLYREIIAVCSEIHTKHINALWAEHRISEC